MSVIPSRVLQKDSGAALTLIGKHLGEANSRVVIDRHKRRFITSPTDMIARVPRHPVANLLNPRQAAWSRCAAALQEDARS